MVVGRWGALEMANCNSPSPRGGERSAGAMGKVRPSLGGGVPKGCSRRARRSE